MHSRAFGHDPRIPGFALGFYEQSSHGLRIIGHGGDTRWFHTDLALIPEEKIGVFVSYNTASGGELSFGPFLTQFLDHYYPTPPSVVAPSAAAAKEAARVAGEYEFNRRSYTTFQKAIGLAGDIRVTAADSGRVIMHSPFGDSRLVPVGPLLYRDELGGDLYAFQADAKGHIARGSWRGTDDDARTRSLPGIASPALGAAGPRGRCLHRHPARRARSIR
jgi:hypothetical protein